VEALSHGPIGPARSGTELRSGRLNQEGARRLAATGNPMRQEPNVGPVMVDTLRAEVEPVPGREGWFQLTGREFLRAVAWDEFLRGVRDGADRIVEGARVLGLHDQETLITDDPRFNSRNPEACRVLQRADGRYALILELNLAEATLLRFIVPASRPDQDEPLPRVGDPRQR